MIEYLFSRFESLDSKLDRKNSKDLIYLLYLLLFPWWGRWMTPSFLSFMLALWQLLSLLNFKLLIEVYLINNLRSYQSGHFLLMMLIPWSLYSVAVHQKLRNDSVLAAMLLPIQLLSMGRVHLMIFFAANLRFVSNLPTWSAIRSAKLLYNMFPPLYNMVYLWRW